MMECVLCVIVAWMKVCRNGSIIGHMVCGVSNSVGQLSQHGCIL